jgi:hypothetical protein
MFDIEFLTNFNISTEIEKSYMLTREIENIQNQKKPWNIILNVLLQIFALFYYEGK